MADSKLDGFGDGEEMGVGCSDGSNFSVLKPSRIHDEGNKAFTVTKLALGTGETEPRDSLGPENTIPLSPQWLLSKPGDSKAPPPSMESWTPGSHGGTSDLVSKERWRTEANRDTEKRRDWRRPATDAESGRRDRWREEERESTQGGRRERWKEVGDGSNDSRRADRWAESSTNTRELVEARRAPSDRWPDSSSRDTAESGRRDSKWSTRWGPEDKDKREKRSEVEKEGDSGQHRDRVHTVTISGRTENDRETDSTARDRIWRPQSIVSRAKGEVPPLGSTPPKYAPGFGMGRGRGESSAIGFAAGRGRGNLSGSVVPGLRSPVGASMVVDKFDAGQVYRYPRAKVLDIYRKSSVYSSFHAFPEAFVEVPQLTRPGLLEPLAFTAPEGEEKSSLEGIRKGDIISSGAVYSTPKDNKHSADSGQSCPRGQMNGGQEEGISKVSVNDAKIIFHVEETMASKHFVPGQIEETNGLVMPQSLCIPGQTESMLNNNNTPDLVHDNLHLLDLDGLMGQSNAPEINNETEKKQGKLSGLSQTDYELSDMQISGYRRETQNLTGLFEKALSSNKKTEILDKHFFMLSRDAKDLDHKMEQEERKEAFEACHTHTPPEELSLFYTDPQGEVQGPFPGSDIIGWFELGYFDTDLLVRVADAPETTPFTQLGDVMPHLKVKSLMTRGHTADDRNEIVDKESLSLEFTRKTTRDSFEQGEAFEPSLTLHDKKKFGCSVEVGRRLFENQLNDDTDVAIEQILEKNFGVGTSTSSLWRSMSAFPDDAADLSKQSLFSQNWPMKSEVAQPMAEAISRPTELVSARVHAPQTVLCQSGTHSSSLDTLPSQNLPWRDASLSEAASFSHGLDDFNMQQLQQFKKLQQLQSHSGLPFQHPSQQSQHSLLNQQQRVPPPLEQFQNPALLHELNVNRMQRLSPPHSSQLLPSHLYSTPQQQQANFQMPISNSIVEQVLKLQQQQQQPYPHGLLEQLLKHQQHVPGATQHFLQDNPAVDHHFEELRQRQALIEHLVRRQQEDQLQAQQQQAHFLQQQQLKFDECRVSGVWEVDEFGQFVRTQASTPMQTHKGFRQQQEILLHHQPGLPQLHQRQAQKLQVEASGLHGIDLSHLQQSKVDTWAPMDFQAERNLAALLGQAPRMESMPTEFLPLVQGERGSFERQSSLPNHGLMPPAMDVLRPSQANDAVAGRGWGSMPHGGDMEFMEMYQRREENVPKIANQQFRQNQLPGFNWQRDLSLVNENLQNFSVSSDFLKQPSIDNQGMAFQMQQQQGMRMALGIDGGLSQQLTASSPSRQGELAASMFFSEDALVPNLSIHSNHQLDSFNRVVDPALQAALNDAVPMKVKREELDWQIAEPSSQMELRMPTQPLRQTAVQGEASDFWITSPSQENSAYAHTMGEPAYDSVFAVCANSNVATLPISHDSEDLSSSTREVHYSTEIMVDEGEFMESKDSKKNKKRSSKSKASAAGKGTVNEVATPVSAAGKSLKLPHVFEELNSVAPPAPSLGDFLVRKEEQVISHCLPAWSVDPNVHVKAAKSLKEIQEAEKKARDELPQNQITNAPKPSNPVTMSSSPSAWQRPLLSFPSQFVAQARSQGLSTSIGKSKMGILENDEQFWDYSDIGVTKQRLKAEWSDHVKRDHAMTGMPVKGSEAPVGGPPLSGFSAPISKPTSSKATSKQPEASSPQAFLSVMEAKGFRQWCGSQIKKFSGKGHMSLLEFCMSLPSVSEAGDYLTMYLGDGPAVEAFKEEFLRHKALIPAEVARVVFPVSEAVIRDELESMEGEKRVTETSSRKTTDEEDNDFEMVRAGKRKGKKGKKVADPSLILGFNVSNSNRILMGEIQHLND